MAKNSVTYFMDGPYIYPDGLPRRTDFHTRFFKMGLDSRDKNQPGQNPGRKPPRTIEIYIEFVQGTFVRDFCTRPTKNRGVRDV